ncbi:MAG: hypothetical protein K2J20_03085 [Bacilli bacterium]|nr:hypothetical protein [Bacilli bacterium]
MTELENQQNIEFIRTYLLKTSLSSKITSHPRFDSILWKISSLLSRAGTKAFSQEAINLLNSIIIIQKDGSIVILENKGKSEHLSSIKYYFDDKDMCLRRVFCEPSYDGAETTYISTYNEEGLEESLLIEQKCIDGAKYYSKTTRIPERIDMIRIERIMEQGNKRELLEEKYQIRTFCVAYEDIKPTADEIDPLDRIHFYLMGVPPIYRDLEPEELKIINDCNGEIFPLDEEHKLTRITDYIERNKFYGRIRNFEGAVARYLSIEDDLPNDMLLN